jgi:hypothetical protein
MSSTGDANRGGKEPGSTGGTLARVIPVADTRVRVGARVISKALAERFAEVLLSDVTHTAKSAALEAGIRPSTVRDAIHRYETDACRTLEDEEICQILVEAKEKHIQHIRAMGYFSAGKDNRAGTAWMQWQLEIQSPKEHPRKQQVDATLTGPDGGAIELSHSAAVQYVIVVPEDETTDADG